MKIALRILAGLALFAFINAPALLPAAPLMPIPEGCAANDIISVADANNATCAATVTIGAGTAITKVTVLSVTWTPSSVAASRCAEQSVAVPGIAITDKLVYNPTGALDVGGGYVRTEAAPNEIAIMFCNPAAVVVLPGLHTANILAVRS